MSENIIGYEWPDGSRCSRGEYAELDEETRRIMSPVIAPDPNWARIATLESEVAALKAQPDRVSVPREPTLDECFAAGKGPDPSLNYRESWIADSPEERERFESYMRGHCWEIGAYDTGQRCYDTTLVRMLYGVWRDRGYLSRLAAAPKGTR